MNVLRVVFVVMLSSWSILFLPLLFAQGISSNTQDSHEDSGIRGPQDKIRRLRLLIEDAGRPALFPDGRQIAFDRKGADGYFDVWIMNADGTGERCLTCGHFEISKNNGNPVFDGSGKFIVFTAENPYFPALDQAGSVEYFTSPEPGINNDLWAINLEDGSITSLTHVKNRHGVLHPHFSPEGTRIVWSEIVEPHSKRMGARAIKIADFSQNGSKPCLSRVQTLEPEGLQLYETYGFSPDSESILFSGIPFGGHYYDMEIYLFNLKTKRVKRLTFNDAWDEHAHFTSDGRYIIWVSSAGIPQVKDTHIFSVTLKHPPRLDFWIMKADGSEQSRLSYFNDPQAREYVDSSDGVRVGDFDIYPGGCRIIADIHAYRKGILAIVDLNRDH